MRIHILVLVVFILRQLQPRQLWEHIIRQPRGYHEINPQPRLRPQQHLIQLHLHSLHRDPLDLRSQIGHGRPHPIAHRKPQLGTKPSRSQQPQWVIGKTLVRCRRRINHPLHEIRKPTHGVEKLQLGRGRRGTCGIGGRRDLHRHGINRKIAAHQIPRQCVPKHHLRIAGFPIINIGTKRGNFYLLPRFFRRHGAIFNTGIPSDIGKVF